MVKCTIWNTDAIDASVTDEDAVRIYSPRAGGNYLITGTAAAILSELDQSERAKLTTWLINERRMGNRCPEITSETIARVRTWAPLTVEERRDRFLLCLENQAKDISHPFRLGGTLDSGVIELREQLAAWTESKGFHEVETLRRFLVDADLIDGGDPSFHITFAGWRHIEASKQKTVESAQGFIAMWFDPSMNAACRDGIEAAIIESGYKPMRVDRKEHINKVDDEIIAEIRRSRFVVADFTSERDKPRGGVYFEAGFAIGLSIPVFWTCTSDLLDQVHFDTRQFNHISWQTPDDLRKSLRNRIQAVLGQGPLKVQR